jgi:uncharacterized Zn finger protein
MPFGPDGWFDGGKPIKVEGGIKARSARGTIGEQWWSRRFIDILEGICAPGRLARGRSYARAGQVLGFEVAPAVVEARVQGSRPDPYEVKITIDRHDEAAWRTIERELADRAVYRAKLLAGEMPPEIVEVFAGLGLPLFPDRFDMTCSCPDWGFPCKHLSAVLYLLAEAFDDDPFLVLAWRGRAREELLDALRGAAAAAPAEQPAAADPLHIQDRPLAEALAGFYEPGASWARVRETVAGSGSPPAPPELLLRVLDPPRVRVRGVPLVDLLRPAYRELPDDPEAPNQTDPAGR